MQPHPLVEEYVRLETRRQVTAYADLDASLVQDVRHLIYRPLTAEPPKDTRVTFSLELLLFRP